MLVVMRFSPRDIERLHVSPLKPVRASCLGRGLGRAQRRAGHGVQVAGIGGQVVRRAFDLEEHGHLKVNQALDDVENAQRRLRGGATRLASA